MDDATVSFVAGIVAIARRQIAIVSTKVFLRCVCPQYRGAILGSMPSIVGCSIIIMDTVARIWLSLVRRRFCRRTCSASAPHDTWSSRIHRGGNSPVHLGHIATTQYAICSIELNVASQAHVIALSTFRNSRGQSNVGLSHSRTEARSS